MSRPPGPGARAAPPAARASGGRGGGGGRGADDEDEDWTAEFELPALPRPGVVAVTSGRNGVASPIAAAAGDVAAEARVEEKEEGEDADADADADEDDDWGDSDAAAPRLQLIGRQADRGDLQAWDDDFDLDADESGRRARGPPIESGPRACVA